MQLKHFRSAHYSTPGEGPAYQKIIQDLQEKIEKRSKSSLHDSYFMFPSKLPYDKGKYAEELKRQITEKQLLKQREKNEKSSPAISSNFNGYPNLPHTPDDLKRFNRRTRMKQVKEDLDKQIITKSLELKNWTKKDEDLEKKISEENFQKFSQEMLSKHNQKKTQKEILTESWKLAIQTNELRKQLEKVKPSQPINFSENHEGLEERRKRISRSKELIKHRVIQLKKDLDARLRRSFELKIGKIIKSSRCESRNFSLSQKKSY
jgi:hypothetical protein